VVARALLTQPAGDGKRQRQGRSPGKVFRANFLTPVPHAASFDALNAAL
jgi:hypothetical protein